MDLDSPQAQVIIGVRRSGKSTLCLQTLVGVGVKFAYVDFDDERLAGLETGQLNDVLEVLYKIYAVDVAMMNQRENAFAGDNWGWRLETTVLIHLIRKCQYEGWDVYYLKERSGECDFVVCDGGRVLQCIQVSFDISSDKTLKCEVNGLLLANRQTKCENLLLLTDYKFDDIEKDGHRISVRPVYEWSVTFLQNRI